MFSELENLISNNAGAFSPQSAWHLETFNCDSCEQLTRWTRPANRLASYFSTDFDLGLDAESRKFVIAIFIKYGDYDFTIAKEGRRASAGERKFNHRGMRNTTAVIEGCYYEETLDGSPVVHGLWVVSSAGV